jgi:hypothetical protein
MDGGAGGGSLCPPERVALPRGGVTAADAHLPHGQWLDWRTGEPLDGESTDTT